MTYYASLALAKSEKATQAGGSSAARPADDAWLLNALGTVSKRIDDHMGYAFEPRIDTLYFDAVGFHIEDATGRLFMGRPLLALTTITVDGTALTASGYMLEPRGQTPYTVIRRRGGELWLPSWSTLGLDDALQSIAITGVWGYRTRYPSDAWMTVDAVTTAAISTTSAVTFTVADVDGADALGRTPRISAGNLLQIDSEWMRVTATNTSTNEVTVRRGINGSTAATHALAAAVAVWQPEEAIVRATARWAAYLEARRAAFATVEYDGMSTVSYPKDMPKEIENILASFPVYEQWGTP